MKKVILIEINVSAYFGEVKLKKSQEKINEYIEKKDLDVSSVSLFKENEDKYIFTLTLADKEKW